MKSVVTFIIPDEYGTLFAKYVCGFFAIIPVCIAFMVIILSVAGAKFSLVWLALSFLISIGCLVISYLMFKYILGDTHKIIVNLSDNTVTKEIRKKPETSYFINDIGNIVSIREFIGGDCRCTLQLNMKSGVSIGILKEYPYVGWNQFVKKLSKVTKKPLIQENWVVDYDGNYKKISTEELGSNRKKFLFSLLIPTTTSFIGAFILKYHPSLQNFLWIGATTVLLNTVFCVGFYLRKESELSKLLINQSTSIVIIIRFVFTCGLYYMLAVFAVNGLKLFNK